jgi:hypothetical protein
MKRMDVKLLQGETEFPIDTLVDKVFEKLKDAPETLTEDDKELFAAAARMSVTFLSDFEDFADSIRAMLYVSPQMASYMMAMFTGGMFAHRALINPNNNLTIKIEEVEVPDGNDQCSSTEECIDTDGASCCADSDPSGSGSSGGESLGSETGEDGA